MSRVLVTGGTGVLGRRLIPRLVAAAHEVRTLSRRERPTVPDGVAAVRVGNGRGRATRAVGSVTWEAFLESRGIR